jgi:UDP-2-acetamido-3-amino-2,3-dideoxy-glucuronate N-acetyltransferase
MGWHSFELEWLRKNRTQGILSLECKLTFMPGKLRLFRLLLGSLLPARLRVFLMRRRGAIIGRGVSLGPLSIFQCGKIVIGDGCRISAFTYFKVRGLLELGEGASVGLFSRITAAEAKIGPETSICRSVAITGARARSILTTGPRCYIGDSCTVDLYCPVTLGEEVGIGGNSRIYTHGSWQSELEGFPISVGEVRAGDFCWMGAEVTIFAGVEIGEFATVGGGTVMRRRVPPYALAFGNPGKVVLQNGDHIQNTGDDGRWELCRQIIEELAEHQEWTGCKVEREFSADHSKVLMDGMLLILRRRVERFENAGAIISFGRMTDGLILEFENAGVEWFDLDRRRCLRGGTTLSAAIRSAFSNHGVRFQTTARGKIADAPDTKRGRKPSAAGAESAS